MDLYRHILIAIDVNDACEALVKNAKPLLSPEGRLTLLHAVESIETLFFGASHEAPVVVDVHTVQAQIVSARKELLISIAEKHALDTSYCRIEIGKPAATIRKFATENDCDLIVMGAHNRKGLSRLLGSTTQKVLHAAPCNVLTIPYPDE